MRALRLPLLQSSRDDAAFLNVEKSARGLKWIERLSPARAYLGAALSQRHGLPEIVGRLLAARDVAMDDVPDLLNPTLRALMPDPDTFAGMNEAAERLSRAILEKERVAIFGDYDVDGAASAALLNLFLSWHGVTPTVHIPDRIAEGYGLNTGAISALIEGDHSLIVAVDCGSSNIEPVSFANERGVDIVIADHHQTGEIFPSATAFVNPNRPDCKSGHGHLCAAGVVFLLCAAVSRRLRSQGAYSHAKAPDLLAWLDLVALATVCDVVPLTGVNRAFVVQGLKVLNRGRNPGLAALGKAAGLNKAATPYTLGFVLGPRINAGGRIGDASLGAALLATANSGEAAAIAQTLDRLNRERREMELRAVEDALASADRLVLEDPDCPILIAGSPDWHKGLVGLIASRLADRFQRPTLIFAHGAGESTGSARSIAGVDLGAAIRAAVDGGLAIKGGGHAMAAGVTVAQDRLASFSTFMRDTLSSSYRVASASPTLPIDGAIVPKSATPEFIAHLQSVGPYGQGNPAPRFCLPSVRIASMKELGGGHLRCSLEAMDGSRIPAVAFRAGTSPVGTALASARDMAWHVAGRVESDEWGGRDRIEFQIEDVAPAR